MHCVSSYYAMADSETHGEADGPANTSSSMGSSQEQSTYKWTDEDTERLIKWRAKNEEKFTGKRNAAMKGFELFIQEHGLEGKVKAGWAKKKWENLKQKYKEVKTPRAGGSTEGGETPAASWKWFDTMEEMIRRRPSPNPFSSAMAPIPDEDVKMRISSLQTQYSRPVTPEQMRIPKPCKVLTKHVNHHSTESILDPSIKDSIDSEPENRELSQDGGESPSHTDNSSVSPPPPPPPPPQPAKKRSKTQSRHDMKRQKLALLQHILEVIEETRREPDTDCEDSFGVTVAMELKRIRNPALRNRVKRQIMTVLYDALDCEEPDTLLYQPLSASPRDESHSITVVLP